MFSADEFVLRNQKDFELAQQIVDANKEDTVFKSSLGFQLKLEYVCAWIFDFEWLNKSCPEKVVLILETVFPQTYPEQGTDSVSSHFQIV